MGGRSTVEVLKAARKRIEDPERWTQNSMARVEQGGQGCSAAFPAAKCWCAYGSLAAENGQIWPAGQGEAELEEAAQQLAPRAKDDAILTINDGAKRATAHKRVLAMYDRAIELAESESKKEGERV